MLRGRGARSGAQPAAATMDYSAEQEMEVEALQAILMDDLIGWSNLADCGECMACPVVHLGAMPFTRGTTGPAPLPMTRGEGPGAVRLVPAWQGLQSWAAAKP